MSKTIAIIGAGPGVGMAVARRFGSNGFKVALLARSQAKLEKLVASLSAEGITAAGFAADVMDREGLATALQQVINRFGSIDVLEYGPAPLMQTMKTVTAVDADAASYQYEFNVLGAIAAVRTVLPGMQQRKEGTILFTTAISAQRPVNITASFGIAAGAQLNYARLLHNNLKADNIYVGSVSIAALVTSEETADNVAVNFPPGLPTISADHVAAQHWQMFNDRDVCEAIVGDAEAILALPGFE